jgi:hypothetical protein
VVNAIKVTLAITVEGEAAVAAADGWKKKMRVIEGAGYVTTTQFKCGNTYDYGALRAFPHVQVTKITISYDSIRDGRFGPCGP